MEYKHIDDCWEAIERITDTTGSVEEVEALFDEFPSKFGEWELSFDSDGEYIVTNTYFDKDADSYEEEQRYLGIRRNEEE